MIFEINQQLVKTSCCKWLILVPLLLPFSPLLFPLFLLLLVLGFMLFPVSCAVIGLLTWQRLRAPPPSLELQADVKVEEKQAKLVECWADENSKGRAEEDEEHHDYGNGGVVDSHISHDIGYDDKNACGDGVLFWYNPLASIFADDDAKVSDGSSIDDSSADERTCRERSVDSDAALDDVASRLINAAMERTRLGPTGMSKMHGPDETIEDDSLEAVLQMAVQLQIKEAAENKAAEEQLLCRLDASANNARDNLTDLVQVYEIDETLKDGTLQAMLDMALQLQIEEGAYAKEMQEGLHFTRANVSPHMLRTDPGHGDDASEEPFQDNASVATIQGEDQDFDCMSYNSETNDFRACLEAELPYLIPPVKRPMIVTSLSSSTSSLFSTSSTITSASTSTSTSSSSQTSPTNNKVHKLIKPVGLPLSSSRKPTEKISAKGRSTHLGHHRTQRPGTTSSKKSDKSSIKKVEGGDAQFNDGHHYYSASGKDRAPILRQHKTPNQHMADPKATMEAHNNTGMLCVDAATRRTRVSGSGILSSDSGTLRKGGSGSESGGTLRRGGATGECGTLKKRAGCSGIINSGGSSSRTSLPESSCIASNKNSRSSTSRRAPLPESSSARGNGSGGGSSRSRSRSTARPSVAAMAAAHSDGEHNPHSSRVDSRSNIRHDGRCTPWSSVGSASATTLYELQEVWLRVVQGEGGGRRTSSSTMAGTISEGLRAGAEVRPSVLLQFWRDMERLR